MNWIRQCLIRRRMSRELKEEIQEHLAEKIDTLMAEGMPRDDAERQARRAFGNVTRIEERSREAWMWPMVESIAAEFERRFAAEVGALQIGDPLDAKTQIGPLAREDLRETLERQVRDSVGMGARVLTGGGRGGGKGWYYKPTVLAEVTEEMPVFKEETFGPVAAVVRVRDADEAVRIANDSAYGLGANLWTRDLALGERLARRIESGSVFVNGMVASDPRLPFGGVKRSGYGRELSSYGIKEFVNIQTIWIAEGSQTPSGPQSE